MLYILAFTDAAGEPAFVQEFECTRDVEAVVYAAKALKVSPDWTSVRITTEKAEVAKFTREGL